MRFTGNLLLSRHVDYTQINRTLIVLILLFSLLLLWNAFRIVTKAGEKEKLDADIAALESRINSRPPGVSEQQMKQVRADVDFYNAVIEKKSYDWLKLLRILENSTPENVALSGIAQDKKSGDLRIEGRTATFDNVRRYLERLEDSKEFKNISLMAHKETLSEDKKKVVEFSLVCRVISL